MSELTCMNNTIMKIENVTKEYRLGAIGGGTLRGDLQSFMAKIRGKEDPNSKIGSKQTNGNERFLALDDVSFEIKKGERVGIIGHNGAGKSTLLKLLSRVTAPTKGTISFDGRIASMLEVGTGFHPELTGRENVYMNGAILGMSKAEITAKFDDIVRFAEMEKFIDTPVKRYSSGMYVKLAFAVAAHLDSEILIMDEVLAVGDMKFQERCLGKMEDVSKGEGRTVLYVSHNMNTIRQLCTRCIVMEHGKVVFDGGVEEGIERYLATDTNEALSIDYTNIPRLKFLEYIRTKIKTTTASFIGKETVSFERTEPMHLHLEWANESDVKNVCLRVEFRDPSRRAVGTSVLYDFYSGKKDAVGSLDLSLDLSQLVPGKYTMNYVFFERNEYGTTADLDVVCGLNFTVQDNAAKIMWNDTMWGRVLLPEPTVIDVK